MTKFTHEMFIRSLKTHLKEVIDSENIKQPLKKVLIERMEGNIRSWEERIKAELEVEGQFNE
jgi:hypothetical protein